MSGPIDEDPSVLSESAVAEIKTTLISKKAPQLVGAEIFATFGPLLTTLQKYQGLGPTRLVCCDAMSVWLLRASQCLKLKDLDPSVRTRLLDFVHGVAMTDNNSSFLFQYVLDFWNESGSPLSNALKDMLAKMVQLLALSRADSRNLIQAWCNKVLSEIPQTKRVFYFTLQTLAKNADCAEILRKAPNFVPSALAQIHSTAFANSVAKCVTAVLEGVYFEGQELEWLEFWESAVANALKDARLCRNVQTYLLPLLFRVPRGSKAVFKVYRKFVTDLVKTGKKDEASIALFLSCLRIAQDLQIDAEPFEGENAAIQVQELEQYLVHKSKTIRLTSYALVTTTAKKSLPVRSYVYELVKPIFTVYATDPDTDSRNEFCNMTRAFVLRIRDSCYALNRKNGTCAETVEAERFLHWLLAFVKTQMCPGMTYQRFSLAYKLFRALAESGLDSRVPRRLLSKKVLSYPFAMSLFDPESVRLLVDNVTNNFDDIRAESVHWLLIAFNGTEKADLAASVDLAALKKRALQILARIQGKQAESGARLLQFVFQCGQDLGLVDELLDKIDESLQNATHYLAQAVTQSPVHGLFRGLCAVLENCDFAKDPKFWPKRTQRTVTLVQTLWKVTSHILSNEAPEGSVPAALQDVVVTQGTTAQVVSNYAWRAVKDSSLALRVMLSRAPLPDSLVVEISDLVLDQLSTVNHKGAFYSVYPTFEACCDKCFASDSLSHLPESWLASSVALVQEKATYIVRRSAGIPYLLSTVLSAETRVHGHNSELFRTTFAQLCETASKPVNNASSGGISGSSGNNGNSGSSGNSSVVELPQVHAFNCIRSLFITAPLSDSVTHCVSPALELALRSVSSDVWALRNCAVMLFASLENKLFGSQKVQGHVVPYSARLFFSKYKGVKNVMLQYAGHSDIEAVPLESVFLVLTILSRLESSSRANPHLLINDFEDFRAFLMHCLAAKQFKIREMAARAFASLVLKSHIGNELFAIVDQLKDSRLSSNARHGHLLALKELWHRMSLLDTESAQVLQIDHPKLENELFKLFGVLSSSASAPGPGSELMALKVFVDVCSMATDLGPMVSQLNQWFVASSSETPQLDGPLTLVRGSLAQLLIKHYSQGQGQGQDQDPDSETLSDLVLFCLLDANYNVQLSALEFVASARGAAVAAVPAISETLWDLTNHSRSSSVKAAALVASQNTSDKSDQSQARISLLLKVCSSNYSEEIQGNACRALGPLVGSFCHSASPEMAQNTVAQWFEIVTKFSSDESGPDLQHAAIVSSIAVARLVRDSAVVCKILFFWFQNLFSDSQNVRDLAADSICDYFAVPQCVSSAAAAVFVENFVPQLKSRAVNELVLFVNTHLAELDTIKATLSAEPILFEEEKENLYKIDHVVWGYVCTMLQSSGATERVSALSSARFASLQKVCAEMGPDTILGWCSSDTVFSVLTMTVSLISLNKSIDIGSFLALSKLHPMIKV